MTGGDSSSMFILLGLSHPCSCYQGLVLLCYPGEVQGLLSWVLQPVSSKLNSVLPFSHHSEVTRARDISIDHDWGRDTGPDMALCSSPSPYITMASDGKHFTHLSSLLILFLSSDLPLLIGHEHFCISLSPILHHIFVHHNGTRPLGPSRCL